MSKKTSFFWVRRGYGPFIPCPSEVKARRRAQRMNTDFPASADTNTVIGLFVGTTRYPHQASYTKLYPREEKQSTHETLAMLDRPA
jgi:hypothetical protein